MTDTLVHDPVEPPTLSDAARADLLARHFRRPLDTGPGIPAAADCGACGEPWEGPYGCRTRKALLMLADREKELAAERLLVGEHERVIAELGAKGESFLLMGEQVEEVRVKVATIVMRSAVDVRRVLLHVMKEVLEQMERRQHAIRSRGL